MKFIAVGEWKANHLIFTNNFGTSFPKKIHAYYDIKTTELHRYEIDKESMIVEIKGTTTKDRIDSDGYSGSDFYVDCVRERGAFMLKEFLEFKQYKTVVGTSIK